MLNNDVRNGKTLKEALTYSDWGERCEEVFKIFQGLEINLEIFKVWNQTIDAISCYFPGLKML